MEIFNASSFMLNVAVAVVVAGALAGVGHLVARKFLAHRNPYLQAGMSIGIGMLLFVVSANGLAYLLPPRLALMLVMVFCMLLSAVVYFSTMKHGLKAFLSNREWHFVGAILTLLLVIFFMNGLYDVYIFDEELHRPLVSTLLSGNFPIAQEGNPFNLSNHYNYHYGMDLLVGGVVALFQLSISTALDVVATINLLLTFLFFYGLTRELRLNPRVAMLAAVLGLMCGGYLMLAAGTDLRSDFYGGNQFAFLYSAYVPLWHGLYVVTFVYVPLMMVLMTLLFLVLVKGKEKKRVSFLGIIVLALCLGGYALIGESEAVLFPGIITLYFLFDQLVAHKSLRVFSVKNGITLIVSLVLATSLVSVQGGFLTGLMSRQENLSSRYLNQAEIEDHFQLQESPSVNAAATGNDLVYFNITKRNNEIYEPRNFFLLLSEVGPYGLFILPFLFYLFCRALPAYRKGTYPKQELILIPLILLMASNIGIPMLLSTGYVADAYLGKFFLVGSSMFYFLFTYFLLANRFKVGKVIKLGVVTLLVLSILPNFILKAYFQYYDSTISTLQYNDPDEYEVKPMETLIAWAKEIQHWEPTWVLATEEESWAVSDLTGAMTYAYFFQNHASMYRDVIENLNPEDLAILGIKAVWVTPTLRDGLSSAGAVNLSLHYELWMGDEEWGMYRLISSS